MFFQTLSQQIADVLQGIIDTNTDTLIDVLRTILGG